VANNKKSTFHFVFFFKTHNQKQKKGPKGKKKLKSFLEKTLNKWTSHKQKTK